jgi:hypothetical protein
LIGSESWVVNVSLGGSHGDDQGIFCHARGGKTCLPSIKNYIYIYDFPKIHMSNILKLEFYVVNSIIASIILCSEQVRDVEKAP